MKGVLVSDAGTRKALEAPMRDERDLLPRLAQAERRHRVCVEATSCDAAFPECR